MDESGLDKRIMIIGSSGCGKTTLAIQLSRILELPVIHLDREYWNPVGLNHRKKNGRIDKINWYWMRIG
jgi:adenylate kinase family enzyme